MRIGPCIMMYSDKATEEERIKDLEERWKDNLGWDGYI